MIAAVRVLHRTAVGSCPDTPPKPGPHLSGYSTEALSSAIFGLAGRSREHWAAFVVAITVAAVNA
jgi:hypothetical protein